MASSTAATTRPAAIAIAKVVFIRPPKKPGGRRKAQVRLHDEPEAVSSDEG